MKKQYLITSLIVLCVVTAFIIGFGNFVNAQYQGFDTDLSSIETDTMIIVNEMKSDRGNVFINKKYYLSHSFRDSSAQSLNYYIKYYDTLIYSFDVITVKRRSTEKVFIRGKVSD